MSEKFRPKIEIKDQYYGHFLTFLATLELIGAWLYIGLYYNKITHPVYGIHKNFLFIFPCLGTLKYIMMMFYSKNIDKYAYCVEITE